jgi:hypothetical protein
LHCFNYSLTAEIKIHSKNKGPIKIWTDDSSKYPQLRVEDEELPILKIAFFEPELNGYDWQNEHNIAFRIYLRSGSLGEAYTIPQADLNKLLAFFGKYYHISTSSTFITFASKKDDEDDEDDYDYENWSDGESLLEYIYQEEALFGYLYVLLDCNAYMKNKSLDDLDFIGTGVNSKFLVDAVSDKCKYADEISKKLIDQTQEVYEILLQDVFLQTRSQEIAEDRMGELVKEVKRQIKQRNEKLVFLA